MMGLLEMYTTINITEHLTASPWTFSLVGAWGGCAGGLHGLQGWWGRPRITVFPLLWDKGGEARV